MYSTSVPLTITRSDFQSKSSRCIKRRLAVLFVGVSVLLLFLWYIGVIGGNVRTVDAGRVYRSAQLTGAHLESVLDSNKIKTVINLRGESSDAEWYRSELASCNARGIDHVDIAFSAVRLPPPDELKKLFAAFDSVHYPILLHCRGGADRSGLSSVIYKTVYDNVPFEDAYKQQLSWHYAHFAWGQAHAMNDFFALYRKDAAQYGLRDWILKKYPAVYAAQPASLKGDAYDVSTKKMASKKSEKAGH